MGVWVGTVSAQSGQIPHACTYQIDEIAHSSSVGPELFGVGGWVSRKVDCCWMSGYGIDPGPHTHLR